MTTDELTTARLDAPLAAVEAHSILAEAFSHSSSPSDRVAYRWGEQLVDHPEWCSTDATYPNWTPAMGCCPAHTVGGAA